MTSYKIIIGDNDIDFLNVLKNRLITMGHSVLDVDTSGTSLLRKVRGLSPDIIIAEANLKGISGFEIAEIIEGENLCPCIVSFKGEPLEYKINISRKKVKTYLKKPVDYKELEYILKHSIEELESCKKEEELIKGKRVINRAKRMLMVEYSLDEEKAYKYIKKKSMDKRLSMYKVALSIIDIIKNK